MGAKQSLQEAVGVFADHTDNAALIEDRLVHALDSPPSRLHFEAVGRLFPRSIKKCLIVRIVAEPIIV